MSQFQIKLAAKPHIELWNDGSGSFSWRWKIVNGDTELGHGMAETRWGARWAAKRAWRRYRKHKGTVEHIPLR